MNFEIIKDWPPNARELRQHFPIDSPEYQPLFPWGKKLYNPRGNDIPADIMFHEEIHAKQQSNNPELWWLKYINNKEFRQTQEIEAYANQWKFVSKALGAKAAKECLDELSDNLSSSLYQLGITKYQVRTLIRKFVI